MEELIRISNINDFLFCPVSIYYHNLIDGTDRILCQSEYQLNGTAAHKSIDDGTYSTHKNILQGREVYSERYGIVGKIDLFDIDSGILTERKKHVQFLHDGYILQTYAQYFCLTEMGFEVRIIRIHSLDDNRMYPIDKPTENPRAMALFKDVLERMHSFDMSSFKQTNLKKCQNCIYEPICGSTDFCDVQEGF